MILRSFSVPAVRASHVRIVVLDNQCTGNTAFHGDQDSDPTSGSDCRLGSPGAGPVPVFGDLPQVIAPRDTRCTSPSCRCSRGAPAAGAAGAATSPPGTLLTEGLVGTVRPCPTRPPVSCS